MQGSQPSQCHDPVTQLLMLWGPPAITLLSLLLHNCKFATVMNHVVNIWYAECPRGDPCERVIWTLSQVENRCNSGIRCEYIVLLQRAHGRHWAQQGLEGDRDHIHQGKISDSLELALWQASEYHGWAEEAEGRELRRNTIKRGRQERLSLLGGGREDSGKL